MSLIAENLSYRIGNKVLLDEVCLTLEPGKIVAVIGANGAGKSTLLSLLAGCPLPTSGRVLLENKPLSQWAWAEIACRRAMLTQSVTLAFDFIVADVVRLGALPYQSRISGEVVEELLERVMRDMSVFNLRDRSCAELSGGECRRVQLARVLLQTRLATYAGNAAYLLLDEPLAALDLAHQFHLMEMLRGWVGNSTGGNIGIVAVMHDLDLAFHCADSVVLLKEGRVFRQGRTREIITSEHIRAALNVNIAVMSSAAGHDHVIVEPVQDRR